MSREELHHEIAELDILMRLEKEFHWIMAEIDNLNAVVAEAQTRLTDLQAAATAAEARIEALKGTVTTGVDPTAVQAAADAQSATNVATQAVIDGLNTASA